MATENQHFDENTDLQASQKLSGDLKALFEPHGSVPPEVDRAVMDKVNRHSVRRRRLLLRWVGPVAAAAAAAVIVFAVMFDGGKERKLSEATAPYSENRAAKQIVALTQRASAAGEIDIDGSGRVDILDAFKLARYIRSTDRPEMKWDINGDGLVNRKDVDVLAFAAVRLDKGV
ncbi:MAG: dockerin type I domain-containing protein, partial [Planctomycetota bacterium]